MFATRVFPSRFLRSTLKVTSFQESFQFVKPAALLLNAPSTSSSSKSQNSFSTFNKFDLGSKTNKTTFSGFVPPFSNSTQIKSKSTLVTNLEQALLNTNTQLTRQFASQAKEVSSGSKDIFQKHIFHYGSIALAVLTPLGFILPDNLALFVDLGLAVLVPFHGYLGMTLVTQDYLPGSASAVNIILLILSLVAVVGLFRLANEGGGVTRSTKALFRNKEAKK